MSDTKLTPEEFVINAIKTLRTEHSKGIHSVYSGFNEAFKRYFDGANPIATTKAMAEAGTIVLRPVRGGVMLYLPGEAPAITQRGEDALRKMGLA